MKYKDISPYSKKFHTGVKKTNVFLTYFSDKKLLRNFGTGINSNNIIGSPIIKESSTLFTGMENYLTTSSIDSEEITIFTVAKRPSANNMNNSLIISNNSLESIGVSLIWNSSGNISFAAARQGENNKATSSQAILESIKNDEWNFIMSEASNMINNTITNLITGETKKSNDLNPRILSSKEFRIGSGYTTSYNGNIEHLITIIINRILTIEEKNQIINSIRNFAKKIDIHI